MSDTPLQPESRDVPLALIDPPPLDARIERDPEFLHNLELSIARDGVLLPLLVVVHGDRFDCVDGYTRWIVCRRLNLQTVPCRVYATASLALEGKKYAATAFHQNFSPADEAVYFKQLYEGECAEDVERVASLVNRSVSYVMDRLDLIGGHDDIFLALKARAIGVGVAKQLNKIKDPEWARYYLQHAVRDGATESTVIGWVQQFKNMLEDVPQVPQSEQPAPAPIAAVAHDPLRCYVCKKSDARYRPEFVPVHTHCKLAILDVMLEGTAPAGESAP